MRVSELGTEIDQRVIEMRGPNDCQAIYWSTQFGVVGFRRRLHVSSCQPTKVALTFDIFNLGSIVSHLSTLISKLFALRAQKTPTLVANCDSTIGLCPAESVEQSVDPYSMSASEKEDEGKGNTFLLWWPVIDTNCSALSQVVFSLLPKHITAATAIYLPLPSASEHRR